MMRLPLERQLSSPRKTPQIKKPKQRKSKVVLGVCAMAKKTQSKPMTQILDRLRTYGEFKVIIFDEKMIFNDPVHVWPRVDCLIAFCSGTFPLHKAQQYVRLHQPFCINDVFSQDLLKNRIVVQQMLEKHNIPVLPRLFVNRDDPNVQYDIKQTPEYLEVNGVRMNTPFIEKPTDADNHNIYIYYGHGKGARHLFRKVKDKSSLALPDWHKVRMDGNYVYEPFQANGKDLKVYTIGLEYAHCETRKSPAVDGIVERDPDDKELRLTTRLTAEEREVARRVCYVFKQNICGFDMIRNREGKSYVIDVNGWSFVKGNLRYYDKCARVLRQMCLGSKRGREVMSRFVPIPSIIALSPKAATAVREAAAKRIMNAIARQQEQSTSDTQEEPTFEAKSINTQPRDTAFRSGYNNDILRSMVVVFRHADRGPKQKVKVKTRHPLFLRFFRKHSQKTEMKITQKKTPQQFMEAGDVIAAVIQEMSQQDLPSAASSPFTRTVTPTPITPKKTPTATNSTIPLRNQDSAMFPPSPMRVTLSQFDSELTEADQKFHEARRQRRQRTLFIANLAKLKQMQIVLRRNLDACKLQIKVLTANEDTGAPERVILICKWGGEITHAGIAQTKAYVPIFWDEMLRPQPPAPPQLTIDPVPMKASTPLAEEQTRQHLKEHAAEHARIAAQFTQVKVATPVAVRNEGDDNTDDSDNEGEEEPDAEEEIKVMQSYADPDYSQARTHFLDGMKVYASGEARVHATARAFIAATNQEEDEHISVQLISDDNVMTYLDDLNATSKQGIMIAKRDVVKLVTSKVNYFTSKSEIERKQIQKIKKTQQAAEQDHLSGSRRPSTQMLRTIASADDVASACEETDLDADEEAEEEKEDNPNVLSGDESEIDTLSVETLYEMRISRLDGDEDPDADIPPELTLPLPSNERDLQFAMTKWGVRCLRWLGVPNESLVLVYGLLKSFQRQIYQKLGLKWVSEELDTDIPEADSFQEYKREKKDLPSKTPNQKQKVFPSDYELCNGESLWNCKERWDALIRDFYDVSDQTFNCTKIPDLYDNIKYDVQHNRPFLKNLRSLYRGIKHVADFVIPQEYGVLRQEKLFIGKQICQKLLNRIVTNLEAGFKPEPETRVHLYFSSESHLHALRNILLLSGLPYNKTVATTLESIEINYLSHVVMRLFEDESRSLDDPKRFYVNVQVSSGAALDPFIFLKDQHLLPVSRPCPVNGRIPFEHFKKMFTSSSFEVVPIKY